MFDLKWVNLQNKIDLEICLAKKIVLEIIFVKKKFSQNLAILNFGQNFFGEKRFLYKILVQNIFGQKISDPTFWLDKRIWVGNFVGQKTLGRKFWREKQIWVANFFGPKKIGSE